MGDWDADHYEKHAIAQFNAAAEVISELEFKGNEHILDVGCGEGKVTRLLAEKVPTGKVIGMDVAPSMLEKAKQKHGAFGNLLFVMGSAMDFKFPEPFDLITSFHALHWVRNHKYVLECAFNSLKPGGRICFLMVSGGDERIGDVFQSEKWREKVGRGQDRFKMIERAEYEKLLPENGFEVESVEERGFTHVFEDAAAVVNHFMTWVPMATGFDAEESRRFAQDLQRAVGLEVRTPTLLVKAKKKRQAPSVNVFEAT